MPDKQKTSTNTPARDALFDDIPVAVIADALDALGLPSTLFQYDILRMAGRRMAGRAITITRSNVLFNAMQADIDPSLDLGTHRAIDEASPGSVIVIAAQGESAISVWGGNMGIRAAAMGISGIVTDGAARDLDEMEELGLAIFARSKSPRSSNRRMVTLSINEPIMCGGVVVRPDDYIIGDGDGVIAVAQNRVKAVAAKARTILEAEKTLQKYVRDGNSLVGAVKKFKVR